jgi:hypothetical protein
MAHTAPRFVIIGGQAVNREEVLHVRHENIFTGTIGEANPGVRIHFIRQGTILIEDVTVSTVLSILNGDPF